VIDKVRESLAAEGYVFDTAPHLSSITRRNKGNAEIIVRNVGFMSVCQNSGFEKSSDVFLGPFSDDSDLPFAGVLSAEKISQALEAEGVCFGTLFGPFLTFWAFVGQMISADISCNAAVFAVAAVLTDLQRQSCSPDSGAYCRARAKIPTVVLRRLTCESAADLEAAIPENWKFHGRTVKLADGTTMTAPDTPENQAAYPQSKTQEEGLGNPMIRMVVVLSLATAMLSHASFGKCEGKETGEAALFRAILDDFQPGEIVLTDRLFCSYFMVALSSLRGLDVVARKHQKRHTDFRKGKRLGKNDHLVVWTRPERPEWMDEETYATIPETLELREIRFRVDQPGFRSEEIIVMTTLLDAEEFPREEIAELYGKRWLVELDIRDLKVTLQMDRLRCLTPFMIEKEIWAHFLAYNLVRKNMAQAAMLHNGTPRGYSFTAALRNLEKNWHPLTVADAEKRRSLRLNLLKMIKGKRVGNRPGRIEPRAKKYRGKNLPFLTKPRAEARAEMMNGKAKTKAVRNQAQPEARAEVTDD